MVQNKSVIFLASPTEYPVPGKHFAVETRKLDTELKENDVLVRNLFLSLDPYMRGRMRESHIKSYVPSFEIGQPMVGGGVSEVIESKNPAFPIGSIVTGMVGWEEYTLVSGGQDLHVIPGARESKIPLSAYIGVLGMPGMSAYSSLKIIGQLKAGETIFISAAAGAV
ncbi:hypothetical protein BGZ98_005867, partial [Dissophora globulifera]